MVVYLYYRPKLMRRTSSTIPFGYRLSEDEKTLEPIEQQLESLDKIKELVSSDMMSLREGAEWLTHMTGRSISHVGLKNIIYGRLGEKS